VQCTQSSDRNDSWEDADALRIKPAPIAQIVPGKILLTTAALSALLGILVLRHVNHLPVADRILGRVILVEDFAGDDAIDF
jgi:hypothetical protein